MSSKVSEYEFELDESEIKKYNPEMRVIAIRTINIIFEILISKLDKERTDFKRKKNKLEKKKELLIKKYHIIFTNRKNA